MEFNTQICTTREQSERLLALGLNPETADMYITNMSRKGFQYTDPWQIGSVSYKDVMSFWAEKGLKLENTYWEIIPAWSLHRLLSSVDYVIGIGDTEVYLGGECWEYDECFCDSDRLYDNVISMVEFCINHELMCNGFIIKSNENN